MVLDEPLRKHGEDARIPQPTPEENGFIGLSTALSGLSPHPDWQLRG
jgi:hypothetical protein